MSNTLEAIHLLEDKLKNLLSNYEFSKKENDILLQNTTKLQHQLIEKQQLLEKTMLFLYLEKIIFCI